MSKGYWYIDLENEHKSTVKGFKHYLHRNGFYYEASACQPDNTLFAVLLENKDVPTLNAVLDGLEAFDKLYPNGTIRSYRYTDFDGDAHFSATDNGKQFDFYIHVMDV